MQDPQDRLRLVRQSRLPWCQPPQAHHERTAADRQPKAEGLPSFCCAHLPALRSKFRQGFLRGCLVAAVAQAWRQALPIAEQNNPRRSAAPVPALCHQALQTALFVRLLADIELPALLKPQEFNAARRCLACCWRLLLSRGIDILPWIRGLKVSQAVSFDIQELDSVVYVVCKLLLCVPLINKPLSKLLALKIPGASSIKSEFKLCLRKRAESCISNNIKTKPADYIV